MFICFIDRGDHMNNDIYKEAEIKKEGFPPMEVLYDLAELFKMFGDSTRIGILCALLNGEMCVYDLAELLGIGQSAVSHQLRLLRASGLVRARKDGKNVYYALDDDHVSSIFNQGMEHVMEGKHGDIL